MALNTDGSNGKVTLAILSTKLDAVLEDTKEIKASGKALEERVRDVENEQVRNKEQHVSMKRDGAILSTIQALGALVGGVFIKGGG